MSQQFFCAGGDCTLGRKPQSLVIGPTRRSRAVHVFAFLWCAVLALAGCGGGGGDRPVMGPAIQQFTADRPGYLIGEAAELTPRFTGGTGRIEPGIGAVTSGVAVRTPPLDGPRDYTLIVGSGATQISRVLRLDATYRDTYRVLDQRFVAVGHSATLAGDGSVIVVGGSRALTTLSDAIDRFVPATGRFQQIGTLATGGRDGHAAVALGDGRLLVVGGFAVTGRGAEAELVDETTGTTAPAGQLAFPRLAHAATRLADGLVLVTGGNTVGEGMPLGISASAELWDPATRQFRLLPERMHSPRAGHTATLLADGRVLIAGGFSSAGAAYSMAEIFDPATASFTPVAVQGTEERGSHVAIALADGSVLMLGGESAQTVATARVLRFRADGTGADPALELAQPRTLAAAVLAGDGSVRLFGGETAGGAISASAERYSPAAGGAALTAMPAPRRSPTVTRLADGRLLILGGENGSGPLDTVLLYE